MELSDDQRPQARNWFVLVAGWPGSGKSTVARAAHRHEGHLDAARSDTELWGKPSRPPGLGPVVPVDTSAPVNIALLTTALATALTGSRTTTDH